MICAELHKSPIEEWVIILEPVSLINDEGSPRHTTQEVFVLQQDLICGHQDIKLELPMGGTIRDHESGEVA